MNMIVGWRDWSAWDRLDRLDTKAGIRKDRSPEEEAATTRRAWFFLYGAWVGIAIFLAVMGPVWNGVSLGLLGLHRRQLRRRYSCGTTVDDERAVDWAELAARRERWLRVGSGHGKALPARLVLHAQENLAEFTTTASGPRTARTR
ncbi:MAG: hypothetical protein M3011_01430 [Actinomycetota bacterium]|nr:hypothetical protein [Actinomycetota bacterium]